MQKNWLKKIKMPPPPQKKKFICHYHGWITNKFRTIWK